MPSLKNAPGDRMVQALAESRRRMTCTALAAIIHTGIHAHSDLTSLDLN